MTTVADVKTFVLYYEFPVPPVKVARFFCLVVRFFVCTDLYMTDKELRELKQRLEVELPDQVFYVAKTLHDTDPRLMAYCQTVAENKDNTHSLWELLAVRKFVLLLERYQWDAETVQQFIRLYEMMKFDGLKGKTTYKLTPVQVFQFANIFGFRRSGDRRLVRQAILFVPRKFGKTTSVASLAVNDLLFGDHNGQAYMAANSQDQSGICFREAKNLIDQIDPFGEKFRITDRTINWKKNSLGKSSSITRLSAGAKTKDGLNASLVIFDEYAASRYVKDHSDGAELLNVLTSSFGTRPNPMTVIITTASRVKGGPFEQMLESAKQSLLRGATGNQLLQDPWQFASIFQPDPWDMKSEAALGSERVWKTCNPHIGTTVQDDFYQAEWEQAKQDREKMKEFLCKYLNVFQTDKVRDWIRPDVVSAMQRPVRVDDLHQQGGGWACFVGMDFSRGDDLCCMAYLCYNKKEKRFFVDVDAWIVRQSLEEHTNSTLYKTWVKDGWLHVVDDAVLPEQIITDRIAKLAPNLQFVRFGYDPYDASVFINYLEAWLRAQRVDPGKMVRQVRQSHGNFNSAVQSFERLVKMGAVEFSENPLWPWCFGNAVLEEDKYENMKPVKRTANAKIDPVICALEGIIMMNEAVSAG